MAKKITNTHRLWLKNVENAIYYKGRLDNFGVHSKRLDILFDMELVDYNDPKKTGYIGVYMITEKGKEEIEKLRVFVEKKKSQINK